MVELILIKSSDELLVLCYEKIKDRSLDPALQTQTQTWPIVPPVISTIRYRFWPPLTEFYTAEEYHQDYYRKNPLRYKFYRHGSGCDQFLKSTWGDQINVSAQTMKSAKNPKYSKPDDAVLKKKGMENFRIFLKHYNQRAKCLWNELREFVLADSLVLINFEV